MKIPKPPDDPKKWTPNIIYQFTKYVDIESESFDFKLEPNKLHEDICAMANTAGGFIVLGIDEIKENGKIIEFKPLGFENGKQDDMGNKIGNSIVNVEPTPNVEIEHVMDESKKIFFTIVKIVGKISERPYFVKGTDQCHARIHNSTRRIGRTAILNLFSYSHEKRKNIEILRNSCYYLKEEIRRTKHTIKSLDSRKLANTPPLDITFIRNAVVMNQSFLQENNLQSDGEYDNFSFIFHTIELINSYIRKFNDSTNTSIRTEIKEMLTSSNYVYESYINQTVKFLDKVINSADKFLQKTDDPKNQE